MFGKFGLARVCGIHGCNCHENLQYDGFAGLDLCPKHYEQYQSTMPSFAGRTGWQKYDSRHPENPVGKDQKRKHEIAQAERRLVLGL